MDVYPAFPFRRLPKTSDTFIQFVFAVEKKEKKTYMSLVGLKRRV